MYLGERNIKTKDPIEASHGDLVVVSKGAAICDPSRHLGCTCFDSIIVMR